MNGDALAETEFLDWSTPAVAAFVDRHAKPNLDQRERAVRLYYAVRDDLIYEIYGARLARASLRASSVIRDGSGLCIHKSIVYVASLRRIGVPARLCLTDVRNHLCSPRLKSYIGGDIFYYHALVSLKLDGRWLRATPVFNERLCRLYKIAPLEFDGFADSVDHPFDQNGRKHMEIINDHGSFDDLPYAMLIDGMRKRHPNVFKDGDRFISGSLRADVALKEVGTS